MTSRRVSLEVLIDDKDPSRCGADCRYLGWSAVRPDGGGLRYSCDLFPQASVEPTRHPECLEATALAAADDAVLEAADPSETADSDTLETVEETALAIIDSLKKEFGDALTPETDDERDVAVRRYFARLREAIDARRKLRATRGTEG